MDAYLVRRVEDRRILGIFWGSRADVWDAVDEIEDPSDFEAARLKPGAIYFEDQESDLPTPPAQWAESAEDDEDPPGYSWAKYSPSEGFATQLYGQMNLRWNRLDFADEGVGLLARVFAE